RPWPPRDGRWPRTPLARPPAAVRDAPFAEAARHGRVSPCRCFGPKRVSAPAPCPSSPPSGRTSHRTLLVGMYRMPYATCRACWNRVRDVEQFTRQLDIRQSGLTATTHARTAVEHAPARTRPRRGPLAGDPATGRRTHPPCPTHSRRRHNTDPIRARGLRARTRRFLNELDGSGQTARPTCSWTRSGPARVRAVRATRRVLVQPLRARRGAGRLPSRAYRSARTPDRYLDGWRDLDARRRTQARTRAHAGTHLARGARPAPGPAQAGRASTRVGVSAVDRQTGPADPGGDAPPTARRTSPATVFRRSDRGTRPPFRGVRRGTRCACRPRLGRTRHGAQRFGDLPHMVRPGYRVAVVGCTANRRADPRRLGHPRPRHLRAPSASYRAAHSPRATVRAPQNGARGADGATHDRGQGRARYVGERRGGTLVSAQASVRVTRDRPNVLRYERNHVS